MTALGVVLGILVVLAITAVTGYFVAQEFAYMAVDRSRLKVRSEAGDAAALRALSITRRTSFMLSGAQLGITVTGLLVGYVAEPLIGSGLGKLLGGVGIPTAVGVAVGAVLAVLFSTVVQMVFGELFPGQPLAALAALPRLTSAVPSVATLLDRDADRRSPRPWSKYTDLGASHWTKIRTALAGRAVIATPSSRARPRVTTDEKREKRH